VSKKVGFIGFDKKSKEAFYKRLDRAFANIRTNAKSGLMKGGIAVRARGQKVTPVGDTGNLVNSWYGPLVIMKTNSMTLIEIGLTADYAVWVHENITASFRKPGAQAKFLEQPLKAMHRYLMVTLKTEGQI
jgi:hypothetical protein